MDTHADSPSAGWSLPSTAIAWSAALAVCFSMLAAAHYSNRDPDSALHVALSVKLAEQPLERWIAPEWWDNWHRRGLYREHPAGILWPAAALARLGYPPKQAAYAVNVIYQILTLVVAQRLALAFMMGLEARALGWILQLLPITFVYRARANHEQAVVLYVLVALLGAECSRKTLWGALLWGCGLVALLLTKGIFVLFALALSALWLIVRARGDDEGAQPALRGAAGFLIAAALALAAAFLYECAYRQVTGESFAAVYLGNQLGAAARSESSSFLVQKASNLAWYAARALYFPLPWTVPLIVALARARRGSPDRRGLFFVVAASALYILGLSLSDRKADRYIFPVYYLLGAAGAAAWMRWSPALQRLARRLDSPLVAPLALVIMLAGFLLSAYLHLPRLKFWPSS